MNQKPKIIYAVLNCPKCVTAKKKFPEAEYCLLTNLNKNKKEKVMEMAFDSGNLTAPILINNDGNIITHKDACIN